MRSRNVKPGFFKNENLADCDPLGRILFIGLWCYADREGRFEWRPKRIKIEILPYDDCDIEKLLEQLLKMKLIVKYEVKGECYGSIPNFLKHQNPHKQEKPSIIPPLVINGTSPEINGTSPGINETRPADSLIPDSLIPDSLIPDSLIPDSLDKNTMSQSEDCDRVKRFQLPKFPKNSEPIWLSELFYELILENDPKAKEPNYQKWGDHIDKLHRIDGRSYDEIEKVIRWTQQHEFEKTVVLSPTKLRKRYAQLRLKWMRDSSPNNRIEKQFGGVKSWLDKERRKESAIQ